MDKKLDSFFEIFVYDLIYHFIYAMLFYHKIGILKIKIVIQCYTSIHMHLAPINECTSFNILHVLLFCHTIFLRSVLLVSTTLMSHD